MLHRFDHGARRGMRIIKRLFHGVDAPAGHARRLEFVDQAAAVPS